MTPNLVYSDGNGNIYDVDGIEMMGRTGRNNSRINPDELIELPHGSDLFELPGRKALGWDRKKEKIAEFGKGMAVAAFISPAHTQFYLASFNKKDSAPVLPLYAYTAVGWMNGKFYVPAMRIDTDIRQDCEQFNHELVKKNARSVLKKYPDNRLVNHLVNSCGLTNFCPAARNFVLNRWECPVPVSSGCNSNCIGCISFQPQEATISPSQERLTFTPTVEEIIQFTVPHLEKAPKPVISFGQGCEGEPLLQWKLIRDSIKEIRRQTRRGVININTNGSMPLAVEELCKAGLNSIRVSLNSVIPEIYNKYYLPNNYKFDDLKESLKIVRKYKGWTSINYFVFPGMTDRICEFEALRKFIFETDLNMIQWRNFNIDPDWYLDKLNYKESENTMGIRNMMKKIKEEFPQLVYGYFNPSENTIPKMEKKIFEP